MPKSYPSDMTDQEWEIIRPLIPAAKRGGRHRSVNIRKVVDAIFYPTLSTPFEIIGLIDTDEITISNKFKELRHRLLNVGFMSIKEEFNGQCFLTIFHRWERCTGIFPNGSGMERLKKSMTNSGRLPES